MNYLALKLPGNGGDVTVPTPPGFKAGFTDLGSTVSGFLGVFFYIAGFLMFFWLAWGVFQYIFAGGNKESLAKARGRITWAIIGFIFVAVSFLISQYAETIFPQSCSQDEVRGCEPKACLVELGRVVCK